MLDIKCTAQNFPRILLQCALGVRFLLASKKCLPSSSFVPFGVRAPKEAMGGTSGMHFNYAVPIDRLGYAHGG